MGFPSHAPRTCHTREHCRQTPPASDPENYGVSATSPGGPKPPNPPSKTATLSRGGNELPVQDRFGGLADHSRGGPMGVRLKRVVNGDSGNRVFKAAGGVQILQPRPLGFAGLPSGGSAGTIQTASKCCRSRPSPVVSRGRQVRLDQEWRNGLNFHSDRGRVSISHYFALCPPYPQSR